MENTKDSLQIKIDEAREKLPKESREAIDAINWKSIILGGLNNKYNQDQLDSLETETELLLSGLIFPEKYQEELERQMLLPKEEVTILLKDMDTLVFKKIQEELEKILNKEIEVPLPPYVSTEKIPIPETNQNVVEENKTETVKENIPEPIAEKAPEPVTPKTEKGIYENSGIEIMPEEILPNTEAAEKKGEEDAVKEEKETTKKEDNILMDSGINVMEEVPLPKEESAIPTTETEKVMIDSLEHRESIARNILMNKLKGSSVSETTVSDYSLPKMSTDKHEDSNTI